MRLRDGRDDLVASADLGDDVDVGLEVEQGGERAADEGLVVGDEDADRGGHGQDLLGRLGARREVGHGDLEAGPPGLGGLDPQLDAGEPGPLPQALQPVALGRCSGRTDAASVVGDDEARRGDGDPAVGRPAVPQDVRHPLPDRPGEHLVDVGGQRGIAVGSLRLDPGARQCAVGPARSRRKADLAVAGDRAPHVRERLAGSRSRSATSDRARSGEPRAAGRPARP